MTYHGAIQRFGIPGSLYQQLRQQCQDLGITLFMLLESAYAELLGRYSGATDLAVGTPVANRRFTELEPLIGFFVNTLVLRNRRGRESVAERLQADREMMLGAFDHQDLPFEKLVEVLNPVRDPSRSPLFQDGVCPAKPQNRRTGYSGFARPTGTARKGDCAVRPHPDLV